MIDRKTEKTQNNYFILVYDSIWDNPISTKPNYLAVFLYILSHAYKKDKEIIVNNQKMLIKRGQWFGSILKIAKHFNISTQTVVRILNYLKTENILEIKSTNKFSLFTVLNYDIYQPQLKADWKTNQKQIKNKSKAVETKDNVYKDNKVNKDNNIISNVSIDNKLSTDIKLSNNIHTGENIYINTPPLKEKEKKKTPQAELVEYFAEIFKKRFGNNYRILKEEYIMMANLLKTYSLEDLKKYIRRFLYLKKDEFPAKLGFRIGIFYKFINEVISNASPFNN